MEKNRKRQGDKRQRQKAGTGGHGEKIKGGRDEGSWCPRGLKNPAIKGRTAHSALGKGQQKWDEPRPPRPLAARPGGRTARLTSAPPLRWRPRPLPGPVAPHTSRNLAREPRGRPDPAPPDCSRLRGGASGSPPPTRPFREGPASQRDLPRGEVGASHARRAPQTPARRQLTRPLLGARPRRG